MKEGAALIIAVSAASLLCQGGCRGSLPPLGKVAERSEVG